MEEPPIYRLPGELRLHIYELALTQPSPVEFVYDYWTTERYDSGVLSISGDSNADALTRTSRQLRVESLRVFYSSNALVLDCGLPGRIYDCGDTERGLTVLHNTINHILKAKPARVDVTVNFGMYDVRGLTREEDIPGKLMEVAQKMAPFPRGSVIVNFSLDYTPRFAASLILDFTIDCRQLHIGFWITYQTIQLHALASPADRLWLSAVSDQFHPSRLELGEDLEI